MPIFISRDLTVSFLQHRDVKRASPGNHSDTIQKQRLLGPEAEVIGISTGATAPAVVLPPQWVNAAEEIREDIKMIREKLGQLASLRHKRLLRVFGDDAASDKDVELVSKQLGALIRRCEQQIHQLKTRGCASAKDQEFRQNVQRSLATQLQQLSQRFRSAQKDYLTEIHRRNKGGLFGNNGSSPDEKAMEMGFTDGQIQELENMENSSSQRSGEISHIASSISELHTVFKELAVLVIDQGSILDRIDYNIEQVVVQSREAGRQLKKAEDHQKSNRAMKCIFALVVANVIMIVILVIKTRQ
mmetsp:Transcript_120224/g.340282  ORF Transcript_120224/g.340282 Transcript_120224/m.340282 type:complete len:301 (+) Transcript_120224:58-960(+)